MVISKTSKVGLKKDSYKKFILVMNGEPEGGISGVMYHDIRKEGVLFSCLMELVWKIEKVFEETQYPMQSMKRRQFRKLPDLRDTEGEEQKACRLSGGGGMTLCLRITYRYHATWQGSVTWIEKGITENFASFLELARWLDMATNGGEEKPEEEGRLSCRISVDNVLNHKLGGRVQQGGKNVEMRFDGVIEFVRCLDAMGRARKEREERMVSAWTMGSYRAQGREATFAVRILFREHATWQGILRWKETGQQIHFRSFLEMMMMMDAACTGRASWRDEKETLLLAEQV